MGFYACWTCSVLLLAAAAGLLACSMASDPSYASYPTLTIQGSDLSAALQIKTPLHIDEIDNGQVVLYFLTTSERDDLQVSLGGFRNLNTRPRTDNSFN